jgi:hypothetical protein
MKQTVFANPPTGVLMKSTVLVDPPHGVLMKSTVFANPPHVVLMKSTVFAKTNNFFQLYSNGHFGIKSWAKPSEFSTGISES